MYSILQCFLIENVVSLCQNGTYRNFGITICEGGSSQIEIVGLLQNVAGARPSEIE